MQVDRVLYPIESLGPGKRLVIWTVGCSKHCYRCSNSELWESDDGKDVPVEELIDAVSSICHEVQPDGFTITGGDPLEQAGELLELLDFLSTESEDILVYTGFTLEELEKKLPARWLERLKGSTGVLIDGRYVDSLNDNRCVLRGSLNQEIHFFKPELKGLYDDYMSCGRKIQNVYCGNRVISAGIHNRQSEYEKAD